jgi:hypothetical protein
MPSHGRHRKTWPAVDPDACRFLSAVFRSTERLARSSCSINSRRCWADQFGSKPGDESEFNAIDIEFFVVKKRVHPKDKTNY